MVRSMSRSRSWSAPSWSASGWARRRMRRGRRRRADRPGDPGGSVRGSGRRCADPDPPVPGRRDSHQGGLAPARDV